MFGQTTYNQSLNPSNMPGPLTIPLITAGAGILGNVIGGLFGNKGRKKETDRARAHDINMWDMTNQYNHPSQQMARLREAGLNPNLVYGGSSGQTAGQANALPGAKPAEIKNIDPSNEIMQYVNLRNTETQTNNVEQQTVNAKKQFDVIAADAELKNAQYLHELDKTDLTKMNTKERKAAIQNINAQKQLTLSKMTGQMYQNTIGKYQADWAKYGFLPSDNSAQSAIKSAWEVGKQGYKKLNDFNQWKKNVQLPRINNNQFNPQ